MQFVINSFDSLLGHMIEVRLGKTVIVAGRGSVHVANEYFICEFDYGKLDVCLQAVQFLIDHLRSSTKSFSIVTEQFQGGTDHFRKLGFIDVTSWADQYGRNIFGLAYYFENGAPDSPS